jgi:hypothetical protein
MRYFGTNYIYWQELFQKGLKRTDDFVIPAKAGIHGFFELFDISNKTLDPSFGRRDAPTRFLL